MAGRVDAALTLHPPIMGGNSSKRSQLTAAAADQPLERTQKESEAGASVHDDVGPTASFAPTPSPSRPPTASASAVSLSSAQPAASQWHHLPLDLLLLVADCVPSYRVLLPLSSTCRRMHALIHDGHVSALSQTESCANSLPTRASCWRRHPTVSVSLYCGFLKVDNTAFALDNRGQLFVSSVLTSLRSIQSLELSYDCPRGPHPTLLNPLRHFNRLRSLALVLSNESIAREQSLTIQLSTTLLSLPSLVSLSLKAHPAPSVDIAVLLGTGTLQRLVSERLLHITLDAAQYKQLTAPAVPSQDNDEGSGKQPSIYPSIQSVASFGRSDAPTLRDILRVFPEVRHVAMDNRTQLNIREVSQLDNIDTLPRLDSLHVYVNSLQNVHRGLGSGLAPRLRCVSLSWDTLIEESNRDAISETLALTVTLEQLTITGGALTMCRVDVVLENVPSIFQNVQLAHLTYLQFTGGLLPADIDYLLSPTSPPAFAASLTHLALAVRWADMQRATAALPFLPALYPSLQRCHIELQSSCSNGWVAAADDDTEWRVAVSALRSKLGAVWCESEAAVRMARLDVAWRRSVGLPAVSDDMLGRG